MKKLLLHTCQYLFYFLCPFLGIGQVVDSLPYYQQQLPLAIYPQNVTLLRKIGEIYAAIGEYDTAITTYHRWVKIEAEQQNNLQQIKALQAIGLVLQQQRNFAEASKYFRETQGLSEKLLAKDSLQKKAVITLLANSYNYLGAIFYVQKQNDSSLWYFNKAYVLRQSIHDEIATSKSLNNIGLVYRRKKEYHKALSYFSKTMAILSKYNDSTDLIPVFDNIGLTYMHLKNYAQAKFYIQQGMLIAERHQLLHRLEESYASMASLFVTMRDFEKAYFYQHKLEILKDSLYDLESSERTVKLQAFYETDKHKKQAALYKSEKALLESNDEKRQLIIYFSLVAFILALVVAIVFYSRLQLKNKAHQDLQVINQELNTQKQKVESQRDLIVSQSQTLQNALSHIEKQNLDIKSSINYAKRIQTAMLPPMEEILRYFPATFVVLQPKDVVSGDFYYFATLPNEQFIFAAVDCTGHGVPGAFMSLIGHTLLDELVHLLNCTQPDIMLQELDKKVKKTLKQHETLQRDGMDLTICKVDRQHEKIQCAGAMNPLLLLLDHTEHLVKGDRYAIGGVTEEKIHKSFQLHEFDYSHYQSAKLYMFSDGFQDQFGGSMVKKFMLKNFRKLLVENAHLAFADQAVCLSKTLTQWIEEGKEHQIDDVLVMGIQIK